MLFAVVKEAVCCRECEEGKEVEGGAFAFATGQVKQIEHNEREQTNRDPTLLMLSGGEEYFEGKERDGDAGEVEPGHGVPEAVGPCGETRGDLVEVVLVEIELVLGEHEAVNDVESGVEVDGTHYGECTEDHENRSLENGSPGTVDIELVEANEGEVAPYADEGKLEVDKDAIANTCEEGDADAGGADGLIELPEGKEGEWSKKDVGTGGGEEDDGGCEGVEHGAQEGGGFVGYGACPVEEGDDSQGSENDGSDGEGHVSVAKEVTEEPEEGNGSGGMDLGVHGEMGMDLVVTGEELGDGAGLTDVADIFVGFTGVGLADACGATA